MGILSILSVFTTKSSYKHEPTKIGKEELYNEEINCTVRYCHKSAINFYFDDKLCQKHSCMYNGCTNINKTNTSYCMYHKCFHDICKSKIVKEGHPYCQLHGCYHCGDKLTSYNKLCYNCKCKDDTCQNPTYDKYCHVHKCESPLCNSKKIYNKKYCINHACSICGELNTKHLIEYNRYICVKT